MNEDYLRIHPEVKLLLNSFYQQLLESKPENPVQFAAEFFTRADLEEHVLMFEKQRVIDVPVPFHAKIKK
jgi:hypothetical protein